MGKRSKRNSTSSSNDDHDIPTTSNDTDSAVVIVLPGDSVASHLDIYRRSKSDDDSMRTTTTKTVIRNKLGNGLRFNSHTKQVYATCSGRLVHKYSKDNDGARVHTYYVEPHKTTNLQQRRYQPAMNDRVVGIVVDRIGATDEGGGDLYRIDINAAHHGILSNLQFAGATKRNKPIFQPGQIVYCRVLNDAANSTTSTDEPILLSCMNGPCDVGIPSKDWTTKENCYGELRNGGTICRISLQLARNLLSSATVSNDSKTEAATDEQSNVILEELAKHNKKIPFEVAIGMNGYVWINSTKLEYIILIQNAIQNSNVLTNEQIRAMVKNLVYVVDKQLQQRNDIS
jgi:exosome complex component RRP40